MFPQRTDLGGPPAAAGQRQAVWAEWAGRVEARHALLALVALVTLAAALARRALQHMCLSGHPPATCHRCHSFGSILRVLCYYKCQHVYRQSLFTITRL